MLPIIPASVGFAHNQRRELPGGSLNPLNWPTSSGSTIGSTGAVVYNAANNLNTSAGNIISNPLGTSGVPSTTDPSGNATSVQPEPHQRGFHNYLRY